MKLISKHLSNPIRKCRNRSSHPWILDAFADPFSMTIYTYDCAVVECKTSGIPLRVLYAFCSSDSCGYAVVADSLLTVCWKSQLDSPWHLIRTGNSRRVLFIASVSVEDFPGPGNLPREICRLLQEEAFRFSTVCFVGMRETLCKVLRCAETSGLDLCKVSLGSQ